MRLREGAPNARHMRDLAGYQGLNSSWIWRISGVSILRGVMKEKSATLLGLIVGGCHFLVSMLIVQLTLRAGDGLSGGHARTMLLEMLYDLTRLLYFPIIGLALYPRHWLPGSWIAVPIMVNSLCWGMVFAAVVVGWRRLRGRT